MPVALTYPGVYIEEVPSGVRTITSVGTSITAFVDFFRQGPMDRAVEVFGMADFERIFGGLDDRSEASYAISQFFLNGGSSALVVRCASEDLVSVPNVLLRTASVVIGELDAPGTGALRVSAASAGVWGNALRAEIDHRTSDPRTLFNLSVTRYASDAPGAAVLGQERFLNLSIDPLSTRFVDAVVNADAQNFSVEALSTNIPAPTGLTGADVAALLTVDFDAMSGTQLAIAVGGSGTFNATLPTWTAGTVTSLVQLASRLEQAIRTAVDAAAVPPALGTPTPPCLTGATVHVATYPTGPATFTSHLVINAGKGDPDRSFADLITVTEVGGGSLGSDLGLLNALARLRNVPLYELGVVGLAVGALISGVEGGDGVAPNADALVGAVADANDRGIFALRKADLFNLLCIPRAAAIVTETNGEAQMQQIVAQATTFCSLERAFFLLDIPQTVNTVTEMKDWLDTHGNFRSRNAAVFFPRIQIPDPVNGFRLRNVGTSGTMAGVFARTDTERGVWKAPAGIEAVLRGVSAMDIRLTDMENGVLNPLAINCLRVFPIYGSVAWGARTLDGADQAGSEWKYTPIRRLALMLEESLFRGTKWVVFEPNDEPLWARVRLNVGAYMMGLFRQGAFQGASPKDAFYVKCDAETTTQADRNLGIINIQVGFAPLKPAEFVVIKIQQIAGDL